MGAMYGMQSRFNREDVHKMAEQGIALSAFASVPATAAINASTEIENKKVETWNKFNKEEKFYVYGAPLPEKDPEGWQKLIIEV